MTDFRIDKFTGCEWDRTVLDDLLAYVIAYKTQHDGITPTMREIAGHYPGMSSSTAKVLVGELVDADKLMPIKRGERIVGYRVPGWSWKRD